MLMTTVNQCMQNQTKNTQNPVAPLINDIELLSPEQAQAEKLDKS